MQIIKSQVNPGLQNQQIIRTEKNLINPKEVMMLRTFLINF